MSLRTTPLLRPAVLAISLGAASCGLFEGWGAGSGNGAITGHENDPPPTPVSCAAQGLDEAQPFDLFVLGDFNHGSSDVEGRVAVGGSATLFNDSFGAALSPDASRSDLLVNFHLYFVNGSVPNGKLVYGGVASIRNVNTLGGQEQAHPMPLDFAWAGVKLQALSTFLASQAVHGDVTLTAAGDRQEVRLVGTDPQLNVFSVPAAELARAASLHIETPAGASVLVNVTGATVSLSNFGFSFAGTDREHTLFNFTEAQTIQLDQIGFQGSILAPNAVVTFPNGQLNGQVVAKSFTGYGQLNHHPLAACVPSGAPVPPAPTDPIVTPPVTFPVDTADAGTEYHPPEADAGTTETPDAGPEAPDAGPTTTDAGTPDSGFPPILFACSTNALHAAQDFDVFVTGDLTHTNSDVEGRVAVGGSAHLSNYSVADKISSDFSRVDLLVAGDLAFSDGSVPNGTVLYGGTGSLQRVHVLGTPVNDASPIDFPAALADLVSYSTYVGKQADTGVSTVVYQGSTCTIDLVGIDPIVNYFSVTPYDLAHANTFRISVPSSSSVIFNVRGTPLGMSNFGIFFTGGTRNNTLFNFPDATQLSLNAIAVDATVLAPQADVLFSNGQLNGQLIAKSLSGTGQVNHHPFTGCVPYEYDETIPPAVIYTWQTGPWGDCSVGGSRIRDVTCLASTGELTELAMCDVASLPPTTQPCSAPETFDWFAGPWGECGPDGTQLREVVCVDQSHTPASTSLCTGTKPTETQDCTPETTTWQPTSWSTCASDGTQTRTITCVSSTGTPLSASECAAAIEALTEQPCTPPTTYSWDAGSWSACAGGTESRAVTCRDATGGVVADSFCDASTKPTNSQTCSMPETYSWLPGVWDRCDSNGSQTRTVTCTSSLGLTVADSFCDPSTKPDTTQSCTAQVTYSWVPSTWGVCVNGTQTRTYTCVSSNGSTVNDHLCGTMPDTTQTCVSPVTYAWSNDAWTVCTASGMQTRTVTCASSAGATVDYSYCDVSTQPTSSQTCTPPVTYTWVTGEWDACTALGTEPRSVTCYDSTGIVVDDSFCSAPKPDSTRACTPPPPSSWTTGTWGTCSLTGAQTRTVTCLSPDGAPVDDSFCSAATKPSPSQPCTAPISYSWMTTTWSECNAASQSRTVTCVSSEGGTVAETFCDVTTKPAPLQQCWPLPPPPGNKNCSYTIGYWKNHAKGSTDAVTPLLPQYLGTPGGPKTMQVMKATTAVEFLSQNVYGSSENGITKLYAQLLGTKFGLSQGADPSAVASTITLADQYLATHSYRDWDTLSLTEQTMVLDWKTQFDDFNNGRIGPGHCP